MAGMSDDASHSFSGKWLVFRFDGKTLRGEWGSVLCAVDQRENLSRAYRFFTKAKNAQFSENDK
jgi:hypothetical protein